MPRDFVHGLFRAGEVRRVLSAAGVVAGALALCLLAPLWVRLAVILLAAVLACREAARLAEGVRSREGDGGTGGLAVTILLTLLLASLGLPGGGGWIPAAPALLLAVLGVRALTLPRAPDSLGWLGATFLAAAWIGLPTAALLILASGENGGRVLLFLFAAVMVGEAGAFLAGKAIGGPRLAPSLSPGKTWAGFVAQLVFGAAAGAAAAGLVGAGFGTDFGSGTGALLGVWLSAAAALGDLFESFWKRAAGRKDSGRLIPGHGGLLDRVDGLLFAAPALLAASWVLSG